MMLTEKQKSEGWRIVKFGDVARECKEKVDRESNPFERYVAGGDMDSESLVIRRWGVFDNDYVGPAFHRVFRKGQILYGSRRTYLKKVAIADFDGVTANTTFVIEQKENSFLVPGLLPYIMLSDDFTKHSVSNSKGSTNPYIVWSDIAKFEFPLPPRPRQEEMLEVFEKIEQTLFEYDKAIVKGHFFLEKLIREKIFTKNNDDDFVPLSSIVGEVREHFSPNENSPAVSYVGFEHIDSNSIQIKEYGSSSDVHSNKLYFQAGDILYGKIRPYLKKTALADFDGVCSSDIIVLRTITNEDSELLSLIIKSDHFANLAMNTVSGSKMPRANWKVLSKLKINKIALESDNFNRCIKNAIDVIRKIKFNRQQSIAIKNKINEKFLEGSA